MRPGSDKPPLRDGDPRLGHVDTRVPAGMRVPGRQGEIPAALALLGGIRKQAAELFNGDHDVIDLLDINERDVEMLILLRLCRHGELTITVVGGRLAKVTQQKESIDFSKESLIPELLKLKPAV